MKKNWIHSEKRGSGDVFRLVDRKVHITPPTSGTHIICDIDKTYLETAFETFFQLASVAFEGANDKVSVQGAKYFLDALQWQRNDVEPSAPCGLHFISSSPPQLRRPINEKFSKDLIHWHSDTLKNQMHNLKKGRVDQLRHHIAYKNAAILDLLASFELKGSNIILIGDNAESDSYIYFGVAALLNGAFSVADYKEYLSAVDVTPKHQEEILDTYEHIKGNDNFVSQIFIRKAPGYKVYENSDYNKWLIQFDDFLHLSFQMYFSGVFELNNLEYVCKSFYHSCFFSDQKIYSYANFFKKNNPGTRSDKMCEMLRGLLVNENKDHSNINPNLKKISTDLDSIQLKFKNSYDKSSFFNMTQQLELFVKNRRAEMKLKKPS